ncbi:MAG: tetratricopeptide repeat protein [Kofleriaceae bacterium]
MAYPRISALVVMVGTLSPLAPARADVPEVAALEAAAEAAFRDGDYAEALHDFERLYRLAPRSELLFAIGRCYQELGRCDRAAEVFADYLASGPDPAARAAAEDRMAACRPAPVVDPPAADPPEVDLITPPVAPAAEPRGASLTRSGSRTGLVLGLGGAGVAVAAVSVVFELRGRGALDDARAAGAVGDAMTFEARYDDANRAHKLAQAGGVVAATTLVAAGVLWWTRPTSATRVAAAPIRGGAVATWSGSF